MRGRSRAPPRARRRSRARRPLARASRRTCRARTWPPSSSPMPTARARRRTSRSSRRTCRRSWCSLPRSTGTSGTPITLDASASSTPTTTRSRSRGRSSRDRRKHGEPHRRRERCRTSSRRTYRGSYVVRVTVSDSAAATSQDATLTVWPAVRPVAFRPIGAEYDRPLDRIVAVADQPAALHVYDPVAGADVDRAAARAHVREREPGREGGRGRPRRLGLRRGSRGSGPAAQLAHDRGRRRRGRDGSALDLERQPGAVRIRLPVAGPVDRAARDDLANGAETQSSGLVYAGGRERLQPGSNHLFFIELGLSPQQLYRRDFNVTTGALTSAGQSPYWGTYGMGSNLWISDDGGQILMAAGTRFRTSDMTYSGALPLTNLAWADAPSAPSAAAGKWLVQPATTWSYPPDTTSNQSFWTYDAVYLANPERFDLPKLGLGSAAFPLHGKYVFFDRSGTKKSPSRRWTRARGSSATTQCSCSSREHPQPWRQVAQAAESQGFQAARRGRRWRAGTHLAAAETSCAAARLTSGSEPRACGTPCSRTRRRLSARWVRGRCSRPGHPDRPRALRSARRWRGACARRAPTPGRPRSSDRRRRRLRPRSWFPARCPAAGLARPPPPPPRRLPCSRLPAR